MLLSAYCLNYGNWTVIPREWRAVFEDLRANGYDAVALSFSEGEMRYGRRMFAMQVEAAHACGLKVFVIPSRLGGRFAGAPLMPSIWLAEHPESQLPENPTLACVEEPAFREWIDGFIGTLCADYPVDGLVWDEPKYTGLVTRHPATLAALGPEPTPQQMRESFARFVEGLTAAARRARPDLEVTLFNMPSVDPGFTARCAHIPGIDYLGFDGAFSRQSYFREEPAKIKHYLAERWARTVSECAAGGKKTFGLVENMLMPRGVLDEFRAALTAFLCQARPDHLCCYYYGMNNEEPEAVQQAVFEIVREHRRSR